MGDHVDDTEREVVTLRVRLDLDLLRGHLGHEDGRRVGRLAVRRWLIEAGFLPVDEGWWTVREDDLGHVDPSEVLEVVGRRDDST